MANSNNPTNDSGTITVDALSDHPLSTLLCGLVEEVDAIMGDGTIILTYANGRMVAIGINPEAGGLTIQAIEPNNGQSQ